MASLALAVAFLAGVLVCQVLLLRYVNTPIPSIGAGSDSERAEPVGEERSESVVSGSTRSGRDEIRCPHCECRTEFDEAFSYCPTCLGRLD